MSERDKQIERSAEHRGEEEELSQNEREKKKNERRTTPFCWSRGTKKEAHKSNPKAIETDQHKPPQVVKIDKEDMNKPPQPNPHVEDKVVVTSTPEQPTKPKRPHNVKRLASAGLKVDSVLQSKTGSLKEFYHLGKKLGQGQFGTTFLCVEKASRKEYACKSILKRKLLTDEDVEDVRREIQIMHHLAGSPNVISIKEAYEDVVTVHVVMELCSGGELFDRIVERGHYTKRKAAKLARTIVGVIQSCHSLGVMHHDLKPENFLFVNQQEDSPLKAIDFGLSAVFQTSLVSLFAVVDFFMVSCIFNWVYLRSMGFDGTINEWG